MAFICSLHGAVSVLEYLFIYESSNFMNHLPFVPFFIVYVVFVCNGNREHSSTHFQGLRSEIFFKKLYIHWGWSDDYFEVLSLLQKVFNHSEDHVYADCPLMGFVNDQTRILRENWVFNQLVQHYSVKFEYYFRIWVLFFACWGHIVYKSSYCFSHFLGNSLGQTSCGESSWLSH